jgi:branched-chain amino acid transport system permease protein
MKRILPYLLFALGIYLLPTILVGSYWIHVLVIIGTYVIAAAGLDLVFGFAGQLSFCPASFFAIGAYASAIFSTTYHIHPIPAMAIGIIFTSLVAYGVGKPVLRLKGYYLAIATLGFGVIIHSVLITFSRHTGGPDGFRDIVPLEIAGYVFKTDLQYYYPIWTVAMVILVLTRNIVHSRVGRAMMALRGDDVAASSMGIDIAKYRIKAFVLSAAYASLAGSLYAHSNRFISPEISDLSSSIDMIVMMFLGGMRTVFGVLIGATIIKSIPEVLESFMDYQLVARGAILILLVLYMPQGLIGVVKNVLGRLRPGRES